MLSPIAETLNRGGPILWAIAALSVLTLALILWKTWRLSVIGAWRRDRAEAAIVHWQRGEAQAAQALLAGRGGLRARVVRSAMTALDRHDADTAREETARIARGALAEARAGLRALDLIVTVAPLLGLLGTVIGMIAAFQTLETSGGSADPAALAGGIWQALLTTAAGMAVAIPAAAALSWFDSITDGLALDFEDIATRIFAGHGGR
ncbi:MotA/TolQ/ExbB proton channel family protein [Thalassococcus sp. CAU 1522]|uniref:MotA/TolQ/ExbB proton channel family protein n=1 Tax=Thalassococcus arenae TaxID=2851652 RepID=A0ABS6N917_9RHOB|nr:MotA/TolQ/ExbB proton channel family protein [Thalassococcus arenae]MBV2360502.1 MotA/TolQ/ExbB proton channel family protein [Thalassococcus arenae]